MDDKSLNIVYESAVEKLTEINSSFDKGILRVAYTGRNRNKSFISKDTFEKCIDTIYNCPIVCNYNRETDSIGEHDVEIVSTSKGMKLVNITQPVGVVPESAKYWWENITEDSGETHEYLCVEILIWKRQEAYSKIKENIITDESMEIKVKSGKTVDGYYYIDSFEFTAFCLLESAEPCYESACIEMFTLNSFRNEYTKMMTEFKEHFSTVTTSQEDDINPQNITQNLSKGGNISLDRMELLSKYGLTVEELDFNIEDFSIEELTVKFEAISKKTLDDEDNEGSEDDSTPATTNLDNEPDDESDTPDDDQSGEDEDGADDDEDSEEFSLSGEQFRDGLIESLYAVKYTDPYWGEISKYMYVDYNDETSEVYCYDYEDWKLYGFSYSMNGDNVIVNFESKKRKKFTIADFDEGSTDFSFKHTFNALLSSAKNVAERKYNEASETIKDMQNELDTLRNYQKSKISEERKDAEKELFARFSDLNGVEAFEVLKADCLEMALEDVESKCFEIRGRNTTDTTVTFSANKPTSTRIAIDKNKYENEPYGGLFIQFPPKNI